MLDSGELAAVDCYLATRRMLRAGSTVALIPASLFVVIIVAQV